VAAHRPADSAEAGFSRRDANSRQSEDRMATIEEKTSCITLINVFTVESAKQQQLVDLLIKATETTMRRLPGFIAANIHRSVWTALAFANYAQWRSVEDHQKMLKNPEVIPHMQQAAALATSIDPKLYEVVEVCDAENAQHT